ncbi:MAG TPA: hypothetical protein VNU68_08380, partial [Verrucomicrobiae bacterium]|nr:hypothetical protein [Verrucomicrobiae bacterium]
MSVPIAKQIGAKSAQTACPASESVFGTTTEPAGGVGSHGFSGSRDGLPRSTLSAVGFGRGPEFLFPMCQNLDYFTRKAAEA